jgi:hippurate hydrolase
VPILPEFLAGFPPGIEKRIRALRRDLHANPELAFREEKTVARLESEMEALEPADMVRAAGTGLIVRMPGQQAGGPTVAIRGDMDALPIHENTGLEYASLTPGVMHACGHDIHASWAAGAAHLLRESPALGDVLIIFQPAEEVGRGAAAMLDTGLLDHVSAIFGGHVDRRFRVGEVVAEPGPLAAAADVFTITLRGSGAHGARPHESRDPVIGAAAIIQSLQTIVSRRINPATAAVVTVGSVHAGTAPNVIPGEAILSGTMRSVDPATRETLQQTLRSIVLHTAEANGLSARVTIERGTPPIVNEIQPTDWARTAVKTVLTEDALKPLGMLNMGGEDFAFYLESMPGCFMRIGAREEGGREIPAHTPDFYAAEDSALVGSAVLAESARVASRALHNP